MQHKREADGSGQIAPSDATTSASAQHGRPGEDIAGSDFTDDDRRRVLDRGVTEFGQGRAGDPLVDACCPGDDRHGHVMPHPARPEPVAQPARVDGAHQNHERRARPRERGPVDSVVGARILLGSHDGHAAGDAGHRDRDPGGGRGSDARADPGHDLDLDTRRSERSCFLSATAEDERVAAHESHDGVDPLPAFDEECVDVGL